MPVTVKSQRGTHLPKVHDTPVSSLEDVQAAFSTASRDTALFHQKCELVQHFSLIESDAARQQVLELARRLAGT